MKRRRDGRGCVAGWRVACSIVSPTAEIDVLAERCLVSLVGIVCSIALSERRPRFRTGFCSSSLDSSTSDKSASLRLRPLTTATSPSLGSGGGTDLLRATDALVADFTGMVEARVAKIKRGRSEVESPFDSRFDPRPHVHPPLQAIS